MSFTDKYILQNLENYNKDLIYGHVDIFLKYVEMINNYLILCMQNIQIQNEDYKKYIIKKGVEMIEHIFHFLLYYTLNPDLTYYHCEQGFIYYIEFINQMSIGDNNLPLSTKDAILFVFKKTIFEITKEYRDNNVICVDDKNNLKIIKELSNIYKNLLFLYIDELNINDNKNLNTYELKSLKSIIANIICNDYEYNDFLNENLNENLNIIDYLMNYIKSNETLSLYNKLNTIELFVKKINKQTITVKHLQSKLYNINTNELLNNYSTTNVNKFINILFN
jgi:predicted RNA-binding protein with EMAP domain